MTYKDYLLNRRPYQEYGHIFLLEKKHCMLCYKPGKGKTYPCIDAVRDVDKSKNGNANVLVLSTSDAIKRMWMVDIVPQNILPQHTVLMSFTQAIQDATKVKLVKLKWDVIIVDESHKIKSNTSKISKLVYQLSKKCEYVWGLTGTPRGNTDLDIFCQFHNMCIADWGNISYSYFVDHCCDIDTKFFKGQMIKQPIGINHRYKEGWERNISMYTQRVEYDEEDEMPDLKVNVIELPYEKSKEYKQAEQGVISIPEYETTMTKLAAITKLHQIVNGYMYIYDDETRTTYHISDNDKLKWLQVNVNNDPTTIVYRFEADFVALQEIFEGQWTEDIDKFKAGQAKILLLQCSRCESFNLQMCKRIIFYTLDYSYIKYNQMLHRIWRIGQLQDVTIEVLLFKNTVESKIWNTVQNKEKLADLFMSIKGV